MGAHPMPKERQHSTIYQHLDLQVPPLRCQSVVSTSQLLKTDLFHLESRLTRHAVLHFDIDHGISLRPNARCMRKRRIVQKEDEIG